MVTRSEVKDGKETRAISTQVVVRVKQEMWICAGSVKYIVGHRLRIGSVEGSSYKEIKEYEKMTGGELNGARPDLNRCYNIKDLLVS